MSENVSLKMGVLFAVSVNMGKNLCCQYYIYLHVKTMSMSYDQNKFYEII